MILHQEFTHEEVLLMQRDNLVFQFLNRAAKIAGGFAYARNGLKMRVF